MVKDDGLDLVGLWFWPGRKDWVSDWECVETAMVCLVG